MRDWRPGISSRAWGKVFRRLNERFDHNDNTVILLDQMRTDFRPGRESRRRSDFRLPILRSLIHFKKGNLAVQQRRWLPR